MQLKTDHIVQRFCHYVGFDTTSSEEVEITQGQLDFSKMLAEELGQIGCSDVLATPQGYVYASLKRNTLDENVSSIGFIAHMDTSPDAPGHDIKPQIVKGKGVYEGQDIITSDGNTLLGADDKAGITAIVSAIEYLVAHQEIKHGDLYFAFTPNEEVGRGTEHFDRNIFKADYAYTIDGGTIGELEYENFNAVKAIVTIKGHNVHPGYAKGIMVNAALLMAQFIQRLPADQTPATTEGRQGFYHVTSASATTESATIKLILRDFDKSELQRRIDFIYQIAQDINDTVGNRLQQPIVSVSHNFQYGNMKDAMKGHEDVIIRVREAMRRMGIMPIERPIRGGTDGAMLTLAGLPCPNLFAGGENFHSCEEYLPIPSLIAATKLIITLSIVENKNKKI